MHLVLRTDMFVSLRAFVMYLSGCCPAIHIANSLIKFASFTFNLNLFLYPSILNTSSLCLETRQLVLLHLLIKKWDLWQLYPHIYYYKYGYSVFNFKFSTSAPPLDHISLCIIHCHYYLYVCSDIILENIRWYMPPLMKNISINKVGKLLVYAQYYCLPISNDKKKHTQYKHG